ncbi:carbohydrate kinase family protein [Undibacterium sp. SXout7W]|uniref:carbohydrate kinase family protein n=1 Tax=Undibacterium sp. SXout7W TaxID=3413049 RepID=UPI003BF17463
MKPDDNEQIQREGKKRRWDILSFGDPVADLVFGVSLPPHNGEKVLGRSLGIWPGGTTANLACAVSKIGLQAAIYGRVGDDGYAAILRASFSDFAVNTDYLETVKQSSSSLAINMLSDSGEKSIVFIPTKAEPLNEMRLREAMQQTQIVYAMPYDLEELDTLSRLARAETVLVAIDIEAAVAPDYAAMWDRISRADVVFFNESGFMAGTGECPNEESISRLLAAGPRLIVVTLGAGGAMAASKKGFARQAAFATPVIDTTGAGDTFNAVFLAAYIEGQTLQDTLRFACAAASKTVATMGARAGMPTRDEILSALSGDVYNL